MQTKYKKYYKLLKDKFTKQNKPNRYIHTLGVVKLSRKLANHYKLDPDDLELASLFHDYTRHDLKEEQLNFVPKEDQIKYQITPIIYHAISAAKIVEDKIKPKNKDIIFAIRYHVWGRPNMKTLEKILLISDVAEENRSYEGVEEIRKMSFINLDKALYLALKRSCEYVIKTGQTLHPEQIETLNYYKEIINK